MQTDDLTYLAVSSEDYELLDQAGRDLRLTRRSFVKILGAGLLISAGPLPAFGQRRGGGGGGNRGGGGNIGVAARVHIAKDGTITILTGKVETGQGSRAELTQAAAEELR